MTSVSVSVTATKVLRNSVPVHCRALRPSHTGDRRRPAGAARISRGPSVSVLLRLTGRGTEAAAPSGEAATLAGCAEWRRILAPARERTPAGIGRSVHGEYLRD
jgi:hypothetical protein